VFDWTSSWNSSNICFAELNSASLTAAFFSAKEEIASKKLHNALRGRQTRQYYFPELTIAITCLQQYIITSEISAQMNLSGEEFCGIASNDIAAISLNFHMDRSREGRQRSHH
jgi:hypothetical protein